MESRQTVSSVHNAIQILREFSKGRSELGVTELSERLNLTKSSVYRIIKTLREENIIIKNKRTRKYQLWLPAFEIGSVVYHEMDICQKAIPLLQKLSEEIFGVVQLVIYDRGDIVYLLKFPEDKETKIFNSMGKRVPAYCTAAGKVLLAFQHKEEMERVQQGELTQFTKNTIVSPENLEKELAKIREVKYAVSKEEFKTGIGSIAVPVFDDLDHPVAAISVTRPINHFTMSNMRPIQNNMKIYSRLITESLEI